jgi:hypothetical protein
MPKTPLGFVALRSIKQGPEDPKTALALIRQIYFKTTRKTIEHDLAHAIELLKSLPDEDTREKATVYMEGLAQMRKDWSSKQSPVGSRQTADRKPRKPRR